VALRDAEDRHGAAPQIRKALAEGKTARLDRFVYSNIAYQCAKLPEGPERERLRNWILETEFGPFGLPRPDINIFLDVPISFVEERLSAQRKGSDRAYLEGSSDIHEADIAFQKTVCSIYRREAELDSSVLRVDCAGPDGRMLPPETITSRVEALVDHYLTC
jgi:dTMP kinase